MSTNIIFAFVRPYKLFQGSHRLEDFKRSTPIEMDCYSAIPCLSFLILLVSDTPRMSTMTTDTSCSLLEQLL